jgi:hypothetical protein
MTAHRVEGARPKKHFTFFLHIFFAVIENKFIGHKTISKSEKEEHKL